MALTSTQQSQIRTILGYASWEIDGEIAEVSNDATREAAVGAWLAEIASIDATLSSGIAQTGVWSTGKGESEMNRSVYLQELRARGRTLCNRLAGQGGVGVVKRVDYFDSSGVSYDHIQ
jgi:hypothetical protein